MPLPVETLVVVGIGLIAVLLLIRALGPVPGRLGRSRKPETRSIRVVGVGGGGGNAVDRMVDARIQGVSFAATNTDAQALRRSRAATQIRIGDAITGGLGSGGDPEIGRRAAKEDEARIARGVAGADLVFVTAGLGGGTGSGAAPTVAAKAREQGALTIAVVTKPFDFEGSHRKQIADTAAAELGANVDALIVVPNDRVASVLPEDTSVSEAFRVVDNVLLQAVQGIIDLIAAPGVINLDFADIRSVMKDAGPALIGLGQGSGEHRATDAARQAVTSPLLEASIEGARGILFNISGPADLRLSEVRQAADEIRKHADADANVIFGTSLSDALGDDVLVTLIATGLKGTKRSEAPKAAAHVAPVAPVAAPVAAVAPVAPVAPAASVAAPRVPPPVPASPDRDEPPIEEPKREPKRQSQSLKARSAVDADAAPEEIAHRAIETPPNLDGDDLEVPSFLRRKGRSSG